MTNPGAQGPRAGTAGPIGLLLLCLLLPTLSGCLRGPIAWQRVSLNQPITQDQVAFIEEGNTRLSDVAAELGAPDEILKTKEQIVARYHFSDGKYFRVDFGWGLRFLIPFISPDLVLGGGGFGSDVFEVACDSRMVVQRKSFALHVSSSRFRLWPFSE